MDSVFLNELMTDEPKAVAVVVERKGSTPVKTGAIMAVNALGQSFGSDWAVAVANMKCSKKHWKFSPPDRILFSPSI